MGTSRIWAAIALLLSSAAPAAGTTATFPVSAGQVGTDLTGDIDLFSTNLNGVTLSKQSLSLDLLLADDVLARILFGDVNVALTIQTNTAGSPGFAGGTTGFLLGPDGLALHSPLVGGGAAASDGTFSIGLVDLTSVLSGLIDVAGVHFDTTFPHNGSQITGARLRFSVNPDVSLKFGTAAQLPEPATAVLLGAAGALLLVVKRWTRTVRRQGPPGA
jgi:hypothetical protein